MKKKNEVKSAPGQAILIGLDKITAKSSKLSINLNKTKNFGPLEIKILKCEKIKNNNKIDNVAYMQVKDTSKSENEKVFILIFLHLRIFISSGPKFSVLRVNLLFDVHYFASMHII